MKQNKIKVLIVGAGFGGTKAALELAKFNQIFDITLLSENDDFRYYPTLFHVATGGDTELSSIKLSKIFKKKNVKLVNGKAKTIDKKAKTITLADGSNIAYDKLILSLGVITNYFGISGLDQFSYTIKSEHEALRFNKHLHDYLTNNKKPDNKYLIVGAGPTGIELSARLPAYIKELMATHDIHHKAIHVEVIEALDQLLPRLPKDFAKKIGHRLNSLGVSLRLSSAVSSQTEDQLIINNQSTDSKTVVWTAGVTNHPFFKDNGFAIGPRGKVAVDVYLQADDNIFVAGDNANTPYSGLAQTAILDGKFIATNLLRQTMGRKMLPYKPKEPITIIPVGKHWAAVLWGKLRIYGLAGAILRQLADIDGYSSFVSWPKVF